MITERLIRRALGRALPGEPEPADPATAGQPDGDPAAPADHHTDPAAGPAAVAGAQDAPAGFGPDGVSPGARVVATASGWVAALAVTGYPAQVAPGWLEPLAAYPGRLDVSLHIEPVPAMAAADRLRKRQARLEAGRRHSIEHGKLIDPLLAAAADDAAELGGRIARGEARLFRVGLYLAVYAPDPYTLAAEVAAVRALAASLLIDAKPASYRQLDAWRACLPVGTDALSVRRTMDTDPIAAGFPFASNDLPGSDPARPDTTGGVLVGFNLGSSGLVFYDEWTGDNYSTVVLGRSGSGKSYFVKCRLLRSLYRDVHAFVVDPEDEYTRLAGAVGGVVIRLGAPGVHLNPLDLPGHTHPATGLDTAGGGGGVAERTLFLHTFLALALGRELTAAQRAVLDEAITTTYTAAGIHPDQPDTWGRPAPLLADLAATLAAHPHPAGPELATELHPYARGAHSGLFRAPTSTPPAGHLVSFSLRELPDELAPLATLLVLDHIWRQVADPRVRRPRMVVIDEAWLLMAQASAARWLWRMAKAFRKHWAALVLVSQDVGDVLGSDLGQAVIANAATQVLFRQADQAVDEVAARFHLTDGEREFLRRAARGELLVSTGNRRVAAKAVASHVEHALCTTHPAELAAHTPPGGGGGWLELDTTPDQPGAGRSGS